jgi:UPF0716 family protein affecting phage T7 exclusion
MKLGINIAIAVVLVLLLLSRPVVLSRMMHHGLVKAVMLCLVVITTVRETCLGVLAAIVFVVLSENVHEGFDLKAMAEGIKNVAESGHDKPDGDTTDGDTTDDDETDDNKTDDNKTDEDKDKKKKK